MLDHRTRYLQIAFNYDIDLVKRVLPSIPTSNRILIEAGTPFIKLEGQDGIKAIRDRWDDQIVADLDYDGVPDWLVRDGTNRKSRRTAIISNSHKPMSSPKSSTATFKPPGRRGDGTIKPVTMSANKPNDGQRMKRTTALIAASRPVKSVK